MCLVNPQSLMQLPGRKSAVRDAKWIATVLQKEEEFILMQKKAGLKFTFGSDTRDLKTGRLDYCKQVASKCGLTKKDLFVPERKIG
jgi:histidinol phosphatase-like PHP family hydrolase